MATQKLTVNRIGEAKHMSGVSAKTNKPYAFNKVGFQTNEYGADRWYDFTFNDVNPLVVGKQYEFEITTREYNGQTYYTASFPKRAPAGGMSPEQIDGINRKLDAISINVQRLLVLLPSMSVPVPPTAPIGLDPAAIDAAFEKVYAENHPEVVSVGADADVPVEAYDDPAKQ